MNLYSLLMYLDFPNLCHENITGHPQTLLNHKLLTNNNAHGTSFPCNQHKHKRKSGYLRDFLSEAGSCLCLVDAAYTEISKSEPGIAEQDLGDHLVQPSHFRDKENLLKGLLWGAECFKLVKQKQENPIIRPFIM